ncbi:MAG: hypothetical protein ACRDLO_03005 [Solirubrobacterales bacterium]
MARRRAPPPLHELEAGVMDEVWRHDEVSVREVLQVLNRGTRQRGYTPASVAGIDPERVDHLLGDQEAGRWRRPKTKAGWSALARRALRARRLQ